jgi:hypothetical protein
MRSNATRVASRRRSTKAGASMAQDFNFGTPPAPRPLPFPGQQARTQGPVAAPRKRRKRSPSNVEYPP